MKLKIANGFQLDTICLTCLLEMLLHLMLLEAGFHSRHTECGKMLLEAGCHSRQTDCEKNII